MASKLPIISTKRGDEGYTSLWSGERVPKNHLAIKCLAEIDLMDSYLGLVKCKVEDKYKNILNHIQSRLIYLKGEVATSPSGWERYREDKKYICEMDIDYLEEECLKIKKDLENMNFEISGWIKYGDSGEISAYIDLCRALARKSEICLYDLQGIYYQEISFCIKKYLNRLSDFLYWLSIISTKTI